MLKKLVTANGPQEKVSKLGNICYKSKNDHSSSVRRKRITGQGRKFRAQGQRQKPKKEADVRGTEERQTVAPGN